MKKWEVEYTDQFVLGGLRSMRKSRSPSPPALRCCVSSDRKWEDRTSMPSKAPGIPT